MQNISHINQDNGISFAAIYAKLDEAAKECHIDPEIWNIKVESEEIGLLIEHLQDLSDTNIDVSTRSST